MLDLSEKGSESEEMIIQTPTTPDRSTSDGSNVKTCVACGTSKTPLWRGGPAGPKSLCNACGIRSRKKIRALTGVAKEQKKSKKSTIGKLNLCQQNNGSDSSTSSSGNSTTTKIGDFPIKNKLWAFGKDLGLQRPRSSTNQKRRMGEVERAAILLMALSCGSVYA